MRSGHARLRARVAISMEKLSLAQLVCELARVLIISGWLMNIAAFSTRDLREQGCKSCEDSHWVSKKLVVPRMFSRELC